MKKVILPVIVAGIFLFAACSKKSSPAKSKTGKTKVVATTYMNAVQALIQAKCTPCHVPSKGGRKADFDNYANAAKFGADMVSRIEKLPTERGFMPFKNEKLAPEEIAVFKKWVADGMPEK